MQYLKKHVLDVIGKGKIIHEHCHKCSGNGVVRKQVELEVEIPAGVDDKNIIILKGKGEIRKKRRRKRRFRSCYIC